MSRREEEKKRSLADLARVAEKAEAMPWLDKRVNPPKPPAPAPPPRPPPAAAPPPPPPPAALEAERLRKRRMEERQAKLEEARALKERRAKELARGKGLEWRGMSWGDVPVGVRRTPFDREEPSLHQKIDDVLGKPAEKEGRAKHRDKGKRQ